MVDVVGARMFPDIANSDAVRIGSRTLFEQLSGEQRVDLIEDMISNVPVKFSEVLSMFDSDYLCKDPNKIVQENMLSNHAKYWGKNGAYLYDRKETLSKLEKFINEYE